jgi:hypothetical protein
MRQLISSKDKQRLTFECGLNRQLHEAAFTWQQMALSADIAIWR